MQTGIPLINIGVIGVLQLPAAPPPPPLTFEMSSLHSANAKSGVVTEEQTLFRTNEWA